MFLTRYRTTAAATLAAFGIAAAGAAFAQAPPAGGPSAANDRPQSRFLRMLDTDEDGKVSMKEITGEQKRLLGAADVDGDGKLSVKEFRRRGRLFMRVRATTLFDLLDANGDQVITADELAAPSARWFKRYDANANGTLEDDELPQRRFGRRGMRGGHHGRGPMRRGGPPKR